MADWLQTRRSQDGFFRTFWLPFTYEETEIKLRWIDPYTFSIPSGSKKWGDHPVTHYAEFIAEAVQKGGSRHIGALLAPANVKYVIVNLLSSENGLPKVEGNYLLGDPSGFIKKLNMQKDIKLILNENGFLVYENEEFIPHIAVFNEAYLISSQFGSNPLQLMERLSDCPSFKMRNQLLVFEEQISLQQKNLLLDNPAVRFLDGKEILLGRVQSPLPCPLTYFRVEKISEVEYNVEIESHKPVFIFIGEPYNTAWNARVDNKELQHFVAFYYANGFYLSQTGKVKVRITFDQQGTKNLLVSIWAISWILLLSGIFCCASKYITIHVGKLLSKLVETLHNRR